jgi:type II secretory pathway component GspD/PulD (secretin)
MKIPSRCVVILIVFLTLIIAGCGMAPSVKEDEEFNNLVTEIIKHDKDRKEIHIQKLQYGIKTLEVRDTGIKSWVTVDLADAHASVVVQRLLDESGTPYIFERVKPYGTVTVRFKNRPLLEALNLILEPINLNATAEQGVVIVRSILDKKGVAENLKFFEIRMRNLDLDTASKLLDGLYPDIPGQGRVLNFGPLNTSNTIYLNGPSEEVAKAARILMQADQDVQHVVIEVLVVEFAQGDLEEVGAKIKNLQSGKWGNINLDYSGNSENIITFAKEAIEDGSAYADYLTTFTAAINILISDNKARLISRPYISTLSGKPATIKIASDRYVVVEEAGGVSSAQPVTSGVILDITPTIMPDNTLRMQVAVEDSQFSRVNIEGVTTEVNKNAATTMMQVEDGQTIIIGGLILNRQAWSNTGFPWLRHIPILNLAFGDRVNEKVEKEVSILVTPHIWKPGLMPPIVAPEAMTIKEGDDVNSILKKYK